MANADGSILNGNAAVLLEPNHRMVVEPAAPPVSRRKQTLRVALPLLAVAGIVTAALAYVHYRHFESTDDAFVEGRVVPVAAKVDGYVVALHVDDNQHVNAGDVIAEIDPRDFEAAVGEAKANVSAGQSRLADAKAKLAVLNAMVEQARAAETSTEADAGFAKLDAARYRAMAKGAVTVQDQERSASIEQSAAAKLQGAKSNVLAAESAAAEGATNVEVAAAEVAMAESKLRQPELNLGYTKIIAPQPGRIARRSVEQGSYVKPGQSLLAIVPDDLWVLANYKETQLADMHAGQHVDIEIDTYPGRTFAGHVDSIQPGSGGRFSLLPPENATGNYVKVVQRIPVKIRFDEPAASMPELAPGMSAEPAVRVR